MSVPVDIALVRSWEPCFDPTKWVDEGWSSDTDGMLALELPTLQEKIWAFMRNDFFTDEQIEDFIANELGGAPEGDYTSLAAKAVYASELALVAAAQLSDSTISGIQAARDTEELRQFNTLASLVSTI